MVQPGGDSLPTGDLPPEVCIADRDPNLRWGDRYVLVDQIGEGGLGTVWKAWDRHLEKFVAIKRIRGEFDAAEAAAFLSEGRIVSRLQHPNIATVFDIGIHGIEPYIVMQLIEGRTLSEAGPWEPHRLADALADVAKALDFSHRHGVLHQDLKPENLMVVRPPGDRERVVVLDFGISRILGGSARMAGRIGTPGFMSPEQEAGHPVDARGDVYGLGATFRALAVSASLSREAGSFIQRCVAIQPQDRFESMSETGKALDRLARLPARRKKAIAIATASGVLLVTALTLSLLPMIRKWRHDRAVAEAITRATALHRDGSPGEAYAVLGTVGEEAEDLRRELVLDLSGYETVWEQRPNDQAVVGVGFAGSSVVSAGRDSKLRYWDAESGRPVHEVAAHPGPVQALAVSHDGSVVATGGQDGFIRLWRAPTGETIREWRAADKAVTEIRFSSDSRSVAAGALDGSVRLWPVGGGETRVLAGPRGAIHALAFSPDGASVASGGDDDRIFVWDLRPGAAVRTYPGDVTRTWCLTFSGDGKRLIEGFAAGFLRVIDFETGGQGPKWPRQIGFLSETLLLPGGAMVVTSAEDGTVWIRDIRNGEALAVLPANPHEVLCMATRGRRLLTGCFDGTIRCAERRWTFGWGPAIVHPRRIVSLTADGRGGLCAIRFENSELTLERPGAPGEKIMPVGASGPGVAAVSGAVNPPLITLYRLDTTSLGLRHVLRALVRRGEAWVAEDIDLEDAGSRAAVIGGSDGAFHVVYHAGEKFLRHARRASDGTWSPQELGPVSADWPEKALVEGPQGPEMVMALESPYRLVSVPVGPDAADLIPKVKSGWYGRISAWRDGRGKLHALVWNTAHGDLFLLSEAPEGCRVRRFALSKELVVEAVGWTAEDGSIEVRWIASGRERIRTARLAPR